MLNIDLSGWYFRFITGFILEWEEWEHFRSAAAFLEAHQHDKGPQKLNYVFFNISLDQNSKCKDFMS